MSRVDNCLVGQRQQLLSDTGQQRLGVSAGQTIVAVSRVEVANWTEFLLAADSVLAASQDLVLAVESTAGPRSIHVPHAAGERLLSEIEPDMPPEVGAVLLGMPAYQAGIDEGDRIVEIEGHPIHTWSDLQDQIRVRPDVPTAITIEREGTKMELSARLIAMPRKSIATWIGKHMIEKHLPSTTGE